MSDESIMFKLYSTSILCHRKVIRMDIKKVFPATKTVETI